MLGQFGRLLGGGASLGHGLVTGFHGLFHSGHCCLGALRGFFQGFSDQLVDFGVLGFELIFSQFRQFGLELLAQFERSSCHTRGVLGRGFELVLHKLEHSGRIFQIGHGLQLALGESGVLLALGQRQLGSALDLRQCQVGYFVGRLNGGFDLGFELFQLVLHGDS